MYKTLLNYLLIGISIGLLQMVFSAGWWIGIRTRALLNFFGIPYSQAVALLNASSLFSRTTSLYVFRKKGLINRKYWFIFLPWSVLGGALSAYIILHLPEQYFLIVMAILLIIWFITYYYQKDKLSTYVVPTRNKVIWYILFIITEAIGWITWGGWIMATHILKHFFNISTLESVWLKKIFLFGRVITSLSVLLTAIQLNYILLLFIVPFSMLGSYIGSHYFIKKWDTFTEAWIAYMGLWLAIYLLYTVFAM